MLLVALMRLINAHYMPMPKMLYNSPVGCWGGAERMKAWHKGGGLQGKPDTSHEFSPGNRVVEIATDDTGTILYTEDKETRIRWDDYPTEENIDPAV